MKKLLLLSTFLVGSVLIFQSADAQYRGNGNTGSQPKGGSPSHGNYSAAQQPDYSQGHGRAVNNDNRGDGGYDDRQVYDDRNRGRDDDRYYSHENRRQDRRRSNDYYGDDNYRRGRYDNDRRHHDDRYNNRW
jgi:hypothetical protein